MDESKRNKIYGSTRRSLIAINRGFSEHPSSNFVPMQIPKATLRQTRQ